MSSRGNTNFQICVDFRQSRDRAFTSTSDSEDIRLNAKVKPKL